MSNEPVPVAAEGVPTLYRLLANYWGHYAEFIDALRQAETAVEGTSEYSAADAKKYEEDQLLEQANRAICSFLPTNRWEARVKAAFVTNLAAENFGKLTESETEALLSSLPHLIAEKEESQ